MPRSASRPAFSYLAFTALMVCAPVALAECPQSTVSCIAKDGDTVVQHDTRVSGWPTAHASCGRTTSASYNRIDRTVTAVASVWWDEASYQSARVEVVERFALQMVPALPVTVRFTLAQVNKTDSGGRTAWETASARLVVNGQEVTDFAPNNMYLDPFLEISTTVAAGVPLEVTYEVFGEAIGNEPEVQIRGHIEFVGIPEGLLIPCNDLLAVRPTTWGAVKSLYR